MVSKANKLRPPIQFPNLFGDGTNNQEIYDGTLYEKVNNCFNGKSFTCLTYGISGSGKTHTIFGRSYTPKNHQRARLARSKGEDKGLIYLAIDQLFHRKAQILAEEPNTKINFTCSFIEIYNE